MQTQASRSKWKTAVWTVVALGGLTGWPAGFAPAQAPRVVQRQAGPATDHQLWDEAWQAPDGLGFLVRRADEVFRLRLDSVMPGQSGAWEPLAKSSVLKDSQFVHGGCWKGRTWLFGQSSSRAPWALDLDRKLPVQFNIDGLQVPGESPPVIQSWVIASQVPAALFMVSGGDSKSWPRPGNRPLYFWLQLDSGQHRGLPVGWELSYLSADQRTAVFLSAGELHAVALDSGREVTVVPDQERTLHQPFQWTNTDPVQPLMSPSRDLAGVTWNGHIHWFDQAFANPLLPSAQRAGNHLAVHIRSYGRPRTDNWSLWHGGLDENVALRHLADQVRDYAMLTGGGCVYVQEGHGHGGNLDEAWVYDPSSAIDWNVLDYVGRPDQPPESLTKQQDRLSVKLVESAAGGAGNHALLRYTHIQTAASPPLRPLSNHVPTGPTIWRREVLLTSSRDWLDVRGLPDDIYSADHIWLVNRRLVWGRRIWQEETKTSQLHLQSVLLDP